MVDFIDKLDAQDQASIQQIVQGIIEDAAPTGASVEVSKVFEDAISGKRKPIAWPWPRLTELSRALLPGTLTVLCGDPGCGKSFFLLEAAKFWHQHGEQVAILELEEDRAYHLRRALAQQCGNGNLFDDGWIAGHPAQARQALADHRQLLDEFGRRVFDCPTPPTLKSVGDWVEARAKAGTRLILVDPITAAATGDKSWAEDLTFVMRAKEAATAHGASVVISIHPKKGQRGTKLGMDDMAGAAAYQRFAQCVIWLEAFDDAKAVMIEGRRASVNRSVAILKCRNGPGRGARLGYSFLGSSLCFAEHGLIDRKAGSPNPVSRAERMHHEPHSDEDVLQ